MELILSHDGHATGSGSRAGGRAAPKAGAPKAAAAPKAQPPSDTADADDLIGDDLAAQLQQVLDEARQELDLDLSGSPQSKQAEAERQSLSGNSVNPFAPAADATQDDREDAGVEPTTIDAADKDPIVTDSAANAVEAFESLDEILANVAADLAADEVTQPAADEVTQPAADANRTEEEASANQAAVAAEPPAAIAAANQPAAEEPVVEVDDLERQLQELLSQAATGAEDDHSISSSPASSVLPELDATTINAQAVTDEIRQMSELIDQVVSQQADDAAAATTVIDATQMTNETASSPNPAAAPMTVLDDDDMAAQIARLMEEHSAAMRGETLPPATKPPAPAAVPAPPVQPAIAAAPVVPAAPVAAAPVAATPSAAAPSAAAPIAAAPIAAAPEIKPSAAASQTSAPGESLHQLDEFLAGHADHAVADEFETINDVIAQRDVTAQGAAMSESASSHDAAAQAATEATLHEEFATPAQMLGQPATAMSPSRQPATTAATAATATTATTATAGASNRAASQRLANLLRTTGRIVIVCKTAAFKACSVLNRPVRNASESTRKIIGYAGLITLGNATFLLLGKLLNILG